MTTMFPIPVWQQGMTQPSVPVNDAMLRQEVLARGATSIISAPPGSPIDGQVHILGAAPSGAWAGFAQHDVVMWRSGAWVRFAPFTGWLKQVGTEVRRYSGTAWEIGAEPSGAAAAAVAAHVAAADPHPQYLTPAEASAAYAAASHTHTAAQISDSTGTGRALLTAADAAAGRTALGLAQTVSGSLDARPAIWSTANLRWEQASNFSFSDANGALSISSATPTGQAAIEIGGGRSGDGPSFFDLVGDTTYADFGTRLLRNGGANARTELIHRGTGTLALTALEAGLVEIRTANIQRAVILPTGELHLRHSATIDAAAGTVRRYNIASSGSMRWQVGGTGDAESGSNAGTNYVVQRFSDAGAFIDAPISISRATGVTTVTSLTIGSNPTVAVQAGTATGQLSRWNNTTGRYEPVTLNTLPDAIDDAAAAGLGVAVGGLYRTGSTLKARIA